MSPRYALIKRVEGLENVQCCFRGATYVLLSAVNTARAASAAQLAAARVPSVERELAAAAECEPKQEQIR